MQKLMLDCSVFAQEPLFSATSKGVHGWVFLLAHCNWTSNGGRIPTNTPAALLTRILPTGVTMRDVVTSQLAYEDDDCWVVYGYDAIAEELYRKQVASGHDTQAKRRNGHLDRSPRQVTSNGHLPRSPTVRQSDRKADRQPDRRPVGQGDRTADSDEVVPDLEPEQDTSAYGHPWSEETE